MLEAEWLVCTDLRLLLGHLIGHPVEDFGRLHPSPNCGQQKASARKFRLFSVACYRAVWDDLTSTGRRVVETAERQADTAAGRGEAARLRSKLRNKPVPLGLWAIADSGTFAAWGAHEQVADTVGRLCAARADTDEEWHRFFAGDLERHIALIRDIFGNPFQPLRVDPEWLTPTGINLARVTYEERAFDRMPILADALEDAGCADAALLEHCRGPGPHARGCHLVDLVLGKE
jgi:hypothetical protein